MKTNYDHDKQAIAKVMAELFEKRITVVDLAKWIGNTQEYLASDTYEKGPDKKMAVAFINTLSWGLLPDLMKCDSQQSRLQTLKTVLPHYFGITGAEGVRKALSAVGYAFMKSFSRYVEEEEEIIDYMAILTTILCLAAQYEEYRVNEKLQYLEMQAA